MPDLTIAVDEREAADMAKEKPEGDHDNISLNRSGKLSHEIKWDNPILDQHSLTLRAHLDATFRYAFSFDRTSDFEDWLNYRAEKRANAIVETNGTTGTGKSYTNLTLSFVTDPKWTPKRNVHYALDGILSSEHRFESPISWNLDEVKRSWGVGSWRESAEWENYVESIRKKRHSVFVATPTRKPLGTTMFCLEPVRMSESDEVVQLAISNAKQHTLGYVIISAPWKFMPQRYIDEYEELKDAYIGKVLGRTGEDSVSEKIMALIEEHGLSFNGLKVIAGGTELTTNDVLELVNDKYPFLQRNNEAFMVAEGIKSRLKLSGIRDRTKAHEDDSHGNG